MQEEAAVLAQDKEELAREKEQVSPSPNSDPNPSPSASPSPSPNPIPSPDLNQLRRKAKADKGALREVATALEVKLASREAP